MIELVFEGEKRKRNFFSQGWIDGVLKYFMRASWSDYLDVNTWIFGEKDGFERMRDNEKYDYDCSSGDAIALGKYARVMPSNFYLKCAVGKATLN